ncbi:unnamed protein product [Hydatigera taeniaeformis]|uniref:Uncharacterized protein n=1 Tax=Hydatigena taeniaeformis TaxID=6205 RepID=A0A3P7G7X3_HYDTA|nr:unnamed protein product [Hydatigera taeniaeformis]
MDRAALIFPASTTTLAQTPASVFTTVVVVALATVSTARRHV